MAITMSTVVDKVEVVGPYRAVQVRACDVFTEDGTEISRGNYHRHVVECQQKDANGDWEDTDVSCEAQEVQDICNSGIWTAAIKEAYRDHMDQSPGGP
jgi:hypothetical protein